MPSILASVTSGSITATDDDASSSDPILDLNTAEEQELPFLSVATVGGSEGVEDKVSVLVMESRCQVGQGGGKLEGMLAVGVDGCKQVRSVMESVVRSHGARVLRSRT